MYQHQQRPGRMAFNPPHAMEFQQNRNHEPRGRGHRYVPNYQRPPPNQSRNEENYWCETCDRGFSSLDKLNNHKQQHQKCNIDGCQFIAHPKVITKHIQMQHSTGLFKKIGNLTNPEDIQKWREERKKKYPTKENVERKAAELKEKIERGEKMGLKRGKWTKNDNSSEGQKRKHSNNNGNIDNKRKKVAKPYNTNHNKQCKQLKKKEILPPPENIRKLKPFTGILDLIMDNDTEIQDENQHCNFPIEDDDDCLQEIKKEVDTISKGGEPSVCGALSSLMCNYGSSDDENEQLPETPKQKHIDCSNKDQSNYHNLRSKECKSKDIEAEQSSSDRKINCNEDNCPPEELKIERPDANKSDKEINTKIEKDIKSKRKSYNHNRGPIKRPKPNLPSTLLQKLLRREIQQERNIMLQCIRHIVKNNYFNT